MLYCFDKKLPFSYSKSEMALAKKNENGILYDSTTKIFTDFLGNEVSIKGEVLFPRTGVAQIYEMNDEIKKKGGNLIINNEEVNKINEWPKYYKTQRKMKIFTGNKLITPIIVDEIEQEFGENIFIKTVEKNFSGIVPLSLFRDSECVFYKALLYHLNDKFIISEPVKILKDHHGIKEYRCFVINNEPYNISRFTTNIFHQIDESILDRLNEIILSVQGALPNSYVVDLMEYESNEEIFIDVVEFNPIHSSGPYLYNSVLEKSDDILHKNIRNISKEFITNIDNCSVEGEVINMRGNTYDLKNSFSSDLRSIYLTGERGITWAEDVELTTKSLAKKVTTPQWEEIESDEDLFCNYDSRDDFTCDSLGLNNEEKEELLEKISRLLKKEKG